MACLKIHSCERLKLDLHPTLKGALMGICLDDANVSCTMKEIGAIDDMEGLLDAYNPGGKL